MEDFTTEDVEWMQRALELARLSEGHTRPNPPVGAVVVKEGRLIGEGRHERAGGAHAEVAAFDACSESPRGATLYVTLEPCSTCGRTPPCTERIIAEGVRRVVVGCEDRNAMHCGRGCALLARSGIQVAVGVCAEEARELALPFFKHVSGGMPFVTLKLAMTLDGCIADRTGSSRWITGAEARAEVQRLRRRADAVMVGSGTVLADDPSLLCRVEGGGDLMRVVVDAQGLLPPAARVLTDSAAARTLVFSSEAVPAALRGEWSRNGAGVELLPSDAQGLLSLSAVMRRLGSLGLLHVLCEGGGELAACLHAESLIDEYVLFYAPAVMTDLSARRGFASERACLLGEMRRMEISDLRMFGRDIRVRIKRR
jgi:diaminohydroxyphosphoribosylaminopyrimidine deaminase / 5-amino-6-(5-phosphoribosylamino)uracil reductase